MSLLELRGIGRPPLAPVTLALERGEIVAVRGPSGAGKTLLLRAIADLDPNEGEALLEGRPRSRTPAPAWRRAAMYVAAQPGWWAERVSDHFEPGTREAARSLAGRLGLPADALEWPVGRLSTGEGARLALVRALVRSPRVLLLDEPTGPLDEGATAAVEAMLQRHTMAGGAILLVTHDAAQARRLARRVLRLVPGEAPRLETPHAGAAGGEGATGGASGA